MARKRSFSRSATEMDGYRAVEPVLEYLDASTHAAVSHARDLGEASEAIFEVA